ncbi:YcaO-like family protein [Roseomonas sp. CCTCC AB2023176]|uniref:YcaO-like family protein n=1 Tax=Roseomonas sp. CCTCC AB2023176 TaxID=3342640 RepID=UPI0035E15FEA
MSSTNEADLRHVAEAFRATMPADALVSVFRIDHLDRTGVPVVQASLIRGEDPAITGYGYGATPIEAEVGALGELCEEVHAADSVDRADYIRGTYAELSRTRAVVDPLTLCLPAGSDYDPDGTAMDWMEGHRWPSGEPVLLPVEWVAAYHDQLKRTKAVLITPITNGLGAGFDLEHAIAHGIMELLQRDGNVINYRALDQGVVVDTEGVTDPVVLSLTQRLRADGIEPVVKLACTDFGMANLYVVGNDKGNPMAPIQVTACGEAVSPDRERTLRKALLEFCGSRARKAATHGPIEWLAANMPPDYVKRQMEVAELENEEPRALAAMTEWIAQDAGELRRRLSRSVFSETRRVWFTDLPTVSGTTMLDSHTRLRTLADRLEAEGLGIIAVDLSPPGHGVRVVKVIVPGLEAETMSYHRIGWRGVRRLRARQDPLILDAPRDGAKRVRLRPEDEARAGGPAWFDGALADRIVGKLYPLYRETGTFSAQRMLQMQRAAAE